ncbi:AraC family transcriptional regulator [Dactylosporangium sp. CA-092794]|uniref:helix-turn-helix transcriptional regulator n=1 Tax=Dactylosporangium sp. CA-092794 TaxID=3239929 RepID=UPI003D94FC72
MGLRLERFEDYALGRPYHAALVELRGRSQPHGHRDYYEVMVVLDGDGRHELSSAHGPPAVRPLHPGDVILVRPRDRHTIAGAVSFYNIAFPAAGWRAFEGLARLDPAWDRSLAPPQRRLPAGDGRAADACAAVLRRFQDAPGELDLIRFWTDIAPLLSPPPPGDPRPVATPGWLTHAVAEMGREEHLRAGVPRLQALAHVSPAHLTRSMRRFYGTTPTAFVAELRLRHAATLLATTTRPVTDIAYACGFSSPSYFTRRFREAHHTAPSQFRRAAARAFVPS